MKIKTWAAMVNVCDFSSVGPDNFWISEWLGWHYGCMRIASAFSRPWKWNQKMASGRGGLPVSLVFGNSALDLWDCDYWGSRLKSE